MPELRTSPSITHTVMSRTGRAIGDTGSSLVFRERWSSVWQVSSSPDDCDVMLIQFSSSKLERKKAAETRRCIGGDRTGSESRGEKYRRRREV